MDDKRLEQKEALETLMEFNERLIKNIRIIIKELSGERLDDTDKFLKGIIDAINWEIAVMNGTMELLNEGKERINKEKFNEKVVAFGEAFKEQDDERVAAALGTLLPEFVVLGEAANEVIAQCDNE